MIRKLISLAIFLLLAHAMYRLAPVWWRYTEFRDAVGEVALFGGDKSEDVLKDRVMELATQYNIPLYPEYVRVRRINERTYIDASYTELLQVLPGYEYPWEFDVGNGTVH